MKNYIGIDNGLDGGIAVLQDNKIDAFVMPTIKSTKSKREYDIGAIAYWIEATSRSHDCMVIIEKAQAMPGQGVTSQFRIGWGSGLIVGIVSTLKLPYTIVHPRTWQKEMFRDVSKKDTKQASAIVAKRLFPATSFLATERSTKWHSGLTDATCLAAYGKRLNL